MLVKEGSQGTCETLLIHGANGKCSADGLLLCITMDMSIPRLFISVRKYQKSKNGKARIVWVTS